MIFANAYMTYNEIEDILSIKNLSARSKCTETQFGLHNITKRYDIEQKPCGFDIEEASYLFKNDVDFLRGLTFIDLAQQNKITWT